MARDKSIRHGRSQPQCQWKNCKGCMCQQRGMLIDYINLNLPESLRTRNYDQKTLDELEDAVSKPTFLKKKPISPQAIYLNATNYPVYLSQYPINDLIVAKEIVNHDEKLIYLMSSTDDKVKDFIQATVKNNINSDDQFFLSKVLNKVDFLNEEALTNLVAPTKGKIVLALELSNHITPLKVKIKAANLMPHFLLSNAMFLDSYDLERCCQRDPKLLFHEKALKSETWKTEILRFDDEQANILEDEIKNHEPNSTITEMQKLLQQRKNPPVINLSQLFPKLN